MLTDTAHEELEQRPVLDVERVDLVTAIASTAGALAVLLLAVSTRLESSTGWSVALFWTAPLACAVALSILQFCGRTYDDSMLRWFAGGMWVALVALLLQFLGFPLVAPDGGPLGTDGSGSSVLYLLFHLGPALGALAGAMRVSIAAIKPAVGFCVVVCVGVAVGVPPLPVMITPDASFTPLLIAFEWALAAVLLVASTVWIRTVGRSPSGPHAWIGVFLLIATYDVALNALGGARFTPIWWASLMLRVSSFVILAGGCLAWLLVSLRASERHGAREISRRDGQLGVAFGLTRRLLGVSDELASGVSLDEVCARVAELTRSGVGAPHVAIRVGDDPPRPGSDPVLAALLERALADDGPASHEILVLRGHHEVAAFLGDHWPTVHEPPQAEIEVGAAAIVPLRSVTGVVAHVALWSPEDHRWSVADEQFLGGLSTQAGQAVARAQAYESMAGAARTLQASLLPARLPDIADLRLLTAYRAVTAGSSVGGDWFDCIRIDDRQVALVIGDVMGKGFRAAAAMGQVRTALRAATAYDPAPAAVLSALDGGVLELEDDEIVTLAYALLDLDSGRLGVARAGHPPPMIARRCGEVEIIEDGGSPPIGWSGEERVETWTTMSHGEALVLYTDGLVESRRESLTTGISDLAAAVSDLHASTGTEPSGWAAWLDQLQARDTWQDDVAVLIALYR